MNIFPKSNLASYAFLVVAGATSLAGVSAPDSAIARQVTTYIGRDEFDRLHAVWLDDAKGAAAKHCEKASRYKMCLKAATVEYLRHSATGPRR